MIEAIAVLLYGSLTLVAALVLAVMVESVLGVVLIVVAAALCYIYHAVLMVTRKPTWLFLILFMLIAFAIASSVIVSMGVA